MGVVDQTPLGPIWVARTAAGVVATQIRGTEEAFAATVAALTGRPPVRDDAGVAAALQQVADFLHGRRQAFDLTLDWSPMQPFQQAVLAHVAAIPYGQWRTYGEIARALGRPGAARAVGRANATNPSPIILPCHRVLGADGKLHGYSGAGGLETKAWLLRLEGGLLL